MSKYTFAINQDACPGNCCPSCGTNLQSQFTVSVDGRFASLAEGLRVVERLTWMKTADEPLVIANPSPEICCRACYAALPYYRKEMTGEKAIPGDDSGQRPEAAPAVPA